MNPLQLSAQFAAYLWFLNQPETAGRPRSEAHQFARLNWERFLSNANEGFGRLLLAVANHQEEPGTVRCRPHRARFAEAAVAG